MRFEFATANRVVFGAGLLAEAGRLAREFGRRALVVTGRDPGRAGKLAALLNADGIEARVFPTTGEPDIETVERGTSLAKHENCDFVVAIGGGSALDAGKSIAAMLTNPGELLDYLEVIGRGQALSNTSAPLIAIPTTAGTGSEVTRNAVLASPSHRVKVSLRSAGMLPRLALVDPELSQPLPAALTASTGLDALTQLIEPFVCNRANPVTDALCVEGLQRAARSLRLVFFDGRNAAGREDMAVASLFGGLALANAGLGAVHGFAGPIGGMFAAPHGAVCAVLLPQVMAANLHALQRREPNSSALIRYAQVARLLSGKPQAVAEEGVEWVGRLVADLGIPRLAAYGLQATDTAELVAKAARASSMKANPIELTSDELSGILQRAL